MFLPCSQVAPASLVQTSYLAFDNGNGSTVIADSATPATSWSVANTAAQATDQVYLGVSSCKFPNVNAKCYATASANGPLDVTKFTNGYQLDFAVRPLSITATKMMIGIWTGGANYIFQILLTGTQVQLNGTVSGSPTGITAVTYAASGFALAQWNTVRMRKTGIGAGTTYSLTVNGVNSTQTVANAPNLTGTPPFMIGCNFDGGSESQQFTGWIDEMHLARIP